MAVREALAGRFPLPRLRPRQGLGAGPRPAAGRVRAVSSPDLGDRGHGAAPESPAAQALVSGGMAGGDPQEWPLGPAAMAAARARQLQDGLAALAQAASGHGRSRAGAARWPG